jgi:hypothetical protein
MAAAKLCQLVYKLIIAFVGMSANIMQIIIQISIQIISGDGKISKAGI